MPSKEEAVNALIWREQDATRNSISAAAQAHCSHKELQGKNTNEMQEMLFQKGINWNDYPSFFKRGVYVQRTKMWRKFTTDELEKLPPKHDAHTNPNLEVERTEIRVLDLFPLAGMENKVEVVFDGRCPIHISPGI